MKLRFIYLLLSLIMTMGACALVGCDKPNSNDKDGKYLLLVNKSNALGAEYVPEELVALDTSYTNRGKSIQLNAAVADAVKGMIDAMKKDGITNVSVTSGYRTYSDQKVLFDKYCKDERAAHPDWSEEQIKAQVLTYSAAPGTSEHQTGLCVDLFTTEMEGLWNYGSETPDNPWDKGFAETDAFEWLKQHAHEYGFILRFPESKTDITGYSYESWHYRYVGVDHAKRIHEQGLTLEEYLK